MSTLEVNSIQPLSSGNTITLGANGKTLDVPSGATLDLTGSTVSGLTTGKIGQVVQNSGNGGVSTTSTSFVEAPISVTITPTAATSKIYVSIAFMNKTATDQEFIATIYRDPSGSSAVNLGDGTDGFFSDQTRVANSKSLVYMQYLDSPNTTSLIEYKVYFKGEGQTVTANNDEADWAFIAMEVLA
jgi:hypothetical protein|tara:strand:+ start:26 stop:583 length:558 start_codon:yes stop_codon:yes gene_type:complete